MDFTNMNIDAFDVATKINSLLKKIPYGKIEMGAISQQGNIVDIELKNTNKVLIRENENALLVLSGEVAKILEPEGQGKFHIEFCYKNGRIYKMIIKYTTKL
jgi:hypothetical protein